MAEHRVRIGGDIRYLEETADKPAVAYVRLVEDRQKHLPDGSWTDDTPRWHDGEFRAGWAKALNEQFQKGDNLIVVADAVQTEREHEGKTYYGSKLRVRAFGPDVLLSNIAIDRTPRQAQHAPQEATQAAEQTVDAEADPGRTKHYDSLMEERARQLSESSRITPGTYNNLGPTLHQDPSVWRARVDQVLTIGQVPDAERHYLTSVIDEYAGAGPALTWTQAEDRAAAELLAEARATPAVPPPMPVAVPAR